jgi:hypothetical protein
MRDWKRYVREHLPLPDIEGNLEAEVIEEIAIQLEDSYREARARGATEEEAEAEARELVTDWSELSSDILGSKRFAGAPRIERRVEDSEIAIRKRSGPWVATRLAARRSPPAAGSTVRRGGRSDPWHRHRGEHGDLQPGEGDPARSPALR